ncbi:MAG: PIN domain-containing protein [Rhodobacteraceae bacterium]|nr:PIN domain-containing protein [Paracoccaceae bacterium]
MRVTIDTCVLYPTIMRELLFGAADAGLFEPRWSGRILGEWERISVRRGPEDEALTSGEIARANARFPAALTPKALADQAKALEQRLYLPDANDIHILAHAVANGSDTILTVNAKDFPRNILAEEGLSRADPDNFLLGFLRASPGVMEPVIMSVVGKAQALSGFDWTPRNLLRKARLPRLGKACLDFA